jgi:hypothetical protein
MSEALSLSERIAARLERLAEMDLAAAEHVHAQLMATTEPRETAELSRAYQRASRTLRQTLMLQIKHERERAAAAAPPARPATSPFPSIDTDTYEQLIGSRIEQLQDVVGRVAAAAYPDNPRLQGETLDRLDNELDAWTRDGDFLLEYLEDQVMAACEAIGLPMAIAREWKRLARPRQTFDPATAAPPPVADTG